jgi:hypothetical protein
VPVRHVLIQSLWPSGSHLSFSYSSYQYFFVFLIIEPQVQLRQRLPARLLQLYSFDRCLLLRLLVRVQLHKQSNTFAWLSIPHTLLGVEFQKTNGIIVYKVFSCFTMETIDENNNFFLSAQTRNYYFQTKIKNWFIALFNKILIRV